MKKKKKNNLFLILIPIIVVLIVITIFTLSKKQVEGADLSVKFKTNTQSFLATLGTVNNIENIDYLRFTITLKNTGIVNLTDFKFIGIPEEFDISLQEQCNIQILYPGKSITCKTAWIEVNNLPYGDINFTLNVETDYKYKNITNVLTKRMSKILSFGKIYNYTIGDFSFSYHYPIYNATEIRNFNDFGEKCFVGECNTKNIRNVICIHKNNSIYLKQYYCDNNAESSYPFFPYCNNGEYYQPNTDTYYTGKCKEIHTINFYYIWNENYNTEGYSEDWDERWKTNFDKLKKAFSELGIDLKANFYEYQLPDNSNLPGKLFSYVREDSPMYQPGDIHIAIFGPRHQPSYYGWGCGGEPIAYSHCQSSQSMNSVRINDWVDADYPGDMGTVHLKHEIGHVIGSNHNGETTSLWNSITNNAGVMGYGINTEYWYECRIAIWLLGQNQ